MPTKIEWADRTWNPVTGCAKISTGCKHCYAARMAKRLRGRFGYDLVDPFQVVAHHDKFEEPIHWRKPARIFVCSMGDLGHEAVHMDWKRKIWQVMADCPQHTFIILTKRPVAIRELVYHMGGKPLPNVWLGVTAENQQTADERIPILLDTPAAVRFVSCEPLLGYVNLKPFLEHTPKLDWVIAGGETGPGARWMDPIWAACLLQQSTDTSTPFFFKKHGPGKPPQRTLYGRTWEELPDVNR